METADERLRKNLDIRPGGCWLWRGHVERTGYGRISFQGRAVWVHRLAYETWVGPIPDGLHIDHTCRVRNCLRPDHLEAVTQAENNRRAWAARFAGKTYPCGHTQSAGGPCSTCREAKMAAREAKRAAKSAPRPKPSETGVRVCGHPYLAPGDCPECARVRAARYREQMKAGEIEPRTITCVECGREQPKCAKGMCRRCYTRLYKRATYVPASRRA